MSTAETASRSSAEVAQAYFACVTSRDPEGMVACWKPGKIDHLHGMADLRAPDQVREWFGNLFKAFPDMEFEVLDTVAAGDKVAVRWRASGTFNGEGRFEGIAPTGSSVVMEGCDLLTIEDGLIVENRAYTNGMDLARQLGALPPQGSVGERSMLGALNLKTRLADAIRRR